MCNRVSPAVAAAPADEVVQWYEDILPVVNAKVHDKCM